MNKRTNLQRRKSWGGWGRDQLHIIISFINIDWQWVRLSMLEVSWRWSYINDISTWCRRVEVNGDVDATLWLTGSTSLVRLSTSWPKRAAHPSIWQTLDFWNKKRWDSRKFEVQGVGRWLRFAELRSGVLIR